MRHRLIKSDFSYEQEIGLWGGRLLLATALFVGFGEVPALSLGSKQLLVSPGDRCGIPLVADGKATPILVDGNDYVGVLRAACDLASDIERVTGIRPPVLTNYSGEKITHVVIVGSVESNRVIQRLAKVGKLETAPIAGKWETFMIVGVKNLEPELFSEALIIAGSDKRGTIYGVYEISEQIGVSPWYWWADVPVKKKKEIYLSAAKVVEGPPAVKYRGIFINDEAPCLTDWVKEKFGNYNHAFYTNVFELLLRLRANYLWPAMWNNAFNMDDSLNPKLADEYGIVMGTSHVEPMMRADKEWNWLGYTEEQWNYEKYPELLQKFWREGVERTKNYEQIITVGMRGKVDTPMSEETKVELLKRVIDDQRKIIESVTGSNAASIPQCWVLYKEVLDYYEKGMRVPDDITIIFCEDNWQNIRRVPPQNELNRRGGYGLYYHFDYVGGPRSYKWLNTIHLPRVWEQLYLAYRYGINRIWIVNVGDIKPMEVPLEFFMRFAWDLDRWPKEKIQTFMEEWAAREFGPRFAKEIAWIVSRYAKFNARRKPELLSPETYSIIHYREAERVLEEWNQVVELAEKVYAQLDPEYHDAYYQLVYYPAKASAVVNELYISVALNRLYARQGRTVANQLADNAERLFKLDAELVDRYHRLGGGKWNHMMKQTHIGYRSWQQPPVNVMPSVMRIAVPDKPIPAVAIEGSELAWPTNQAAILPVIDVFNKQTRYIEVFNRGSVPFRFTVTSEAPYVRLTPTDGIVTNQVRIRVDVDWDIAPYGRQTNRIIVKPEVGEAITVFAETFKPREITPEDLDGFIESEGVVSIEAAHYTANVPGKEGMWQEIPDFGHTLSGMCVFPVTVSSVMPTSEDSPRLEYRIYLFTTGQVQVVTIIAPTLNFLPDRPLRLAVSMNDEKPQVITAVPVGYRAGEGNRDWEEAVRNNYRKLTTYHTIQKPGYHTLKIWMVDPGVVVQKIIVNTGGLKPSYLGPPESWFNIKSRNIRKS